MEFKVSIYTLTGQLIYNDTVVKDTQIPLKKGLYMVKIDEKSTKVMVL
ncbi:MAG TPA: T9SS type A sorting domain-containing protein [Paludibacter sp.]